MHAADGAPPRRQNKENIDFVARNRLPKAPTGMKPGPASGEAATGPKPLVGFGRSVQPKPESAAPKPARGSAGLSRVPAVALRAPPPRATTAPKATAGAAASTAATARSPVRNEQSPSKGRPSSVHTKPAAGKPSGQQMPGSKAAAGPEGEEGGAKAKGWCGAVSQARFNPIKTSDPFAKTESHKTHFGQLYAAGNIPCRINHGAVHMHLKWEKDPSELPYGTTLVACCEGLCETEHPYVFIARQAFKEMLQAEGAYEKTVSLVPRLITPLRMALLNKNKICFEAGLEGVRELAEVVGEHLAPHISALLIQINKRAFDKAHRDDITRTLQCIEQNCGQTVLPFIKQKVPTYTTIFS